MEDRRGGGSGPAAWGSAGGAGHQWGSTVATSCDVEDWRLCGRPNALGWRRGVGWRHGALVAWCGWVEARTGDEGRGGVVVRG
jgi:hypothetical protein